MSSRAYMTIIVLASLAGRAGADDGTAGTDGATSKDDGFFTRINGSMRRSRREFWTSVKTMPRKCLRNAICFGMSASGGIL